MPSFLNAESRLIGELAQAITASQSDNIQVRFRDRVTGAAREPDADTRLFIIDKGDEDNPNQKYEYIYSPNGHSTASGITTLANGVVRGLAYSGTALTGNASLTFSHQEGAEVGVANSHFLTNAANGFVGGTAPSGANKIIIGDGTASDNTIEFSTDATVNPIIYVDDSNQSMYKGNRGDDEGAAGDFQIGKPRLTTAERDALTGVFDGMEIYNNTDGVFQDRVGGAWVNRAAGATPNASETVTGKVRLNTAARTDSATDTDAGDPTVNKPSETARVIQESKYTFAADAGGTDAYAITLTPAPASYTTGQKFKFTANTANTGACTLNVNGLGAIDIKKRNDQDPETGDIEAGQVVEVVYDGTNFQMVSQLAQTPPFALTLIEEQTASSDATLDFETGIGADFDAYLFKFIDVRPVTDNVQFRTRFSTDGGSSYITTNYDYKTSNIGVTSGYADATGQSFIRLSGGNAVGNTSYETLYGEMNFYRNPDLSRVFCHGTTNYSDGSGNFRAVTFAGRLGNAIFTGVVDAIQFFFDTGNIASGTIQLYGLKNS